MTETYIPDGRETAVQINKRLDAEKAQAAAEIAPLLVKRYLAICANSASPGLSIRLMEDLPLTAMGKKYYCDIDVLSAVTRILREKHWRATFTNGYAQITPFETIVVEPDDWLSRF